MLALSPSSKDKFFRPLKDQKLCSNGESKAKEQARGPSIEAFDSKVLPDIFGDGQDRDFLSGSLYAYLEEIEGLANNDL